MTVTLFPLNHTESLPEKYRGGTVIIGNFDGIHRGHAGVIALAKNCPHPHLLLSFSPHPIVFFQPQNTHYQLSNAWQKTYWLESLGIDALIELKFEQALAETSADDFITKILIQNLAAHTVITGDDFHFGKNRTGNAETLRKYAKKQAFHYIEAQAQNNQQGVRFSSSAVRQALKQGKMKVANHILGRPYQISGMVIAGEKIGRTLGFPTANINPGIYFPPPYGVYAISAKHPDTGKILPGVANFGTRPVLGGKKPMLESYFFDFHDDLYRKYMAINLWYFLRAEVNFATLDLLKIQIAKDCLQAKQALADQDFTNHFGI